MTKGLIVGGEFGNILVRKRQDCILELGELLLANTAKGKMLLQVFDLIYGSQLPKQQLELIAGLKLEENDKLSLMDENLRNYILARLKTLVEIGDKPHSAKQLPSFFTKVSKITSSDVSFLEAPSNPLHLGFLRSGSNYLSDVPVSIDGKKAISHHILIAGTTGRGKSVFMTNLLVNLIDKDYGALLVLDPHNEYFEKLRGNENARDRLVYYTPANPPAGARTLKVKLEKLLPWHFNGVVTWSEAQKDAISAYYAKYGVDWIKAAILLKALPGNFHEGTLGVVQRKLTRILSLQVTDTELIVCTGVFSETQGETTINDIVNALLESKTVIIDTSSFHGNVEVLIGSMLASKVLSKQKAATLSARHSRPVIGIVLEEAPRVLGKEVLERGSNVFATIAREGRKFNVGIVAITQLPSLIPRQVLANMNTKIIFGIELRPERTAIIESAAQDLSSDDRMIASLDKGEIIVSSNFLSFAMPLKVVFTEQKSTSHKNAFGGLNI